MLNTTELQNICLDIVFPCFPMFFLTICLGFPAACYFESSELDAALTFSSISVHSFLLRLCNWCARITWITWLCLLAALKEINRCCKADQGSKAMATNFCISDEILIQTGSLWGFPEAPRSNHVIICNCASYIIICVLHISSWSSCFWKLRPVSVQRWVALPIHL